MSSYLDQITKQFESYVYVGNSAWDYLLAVVIFLVCLIILYIFRSIVLAYLKGLSKKTNNQLDDTLMNIFSNVDKLAYPALALYFALSYLTLSVTIDRIISVIFVIILAREILKAAKSVYKYYVEKHLEKYQKESEKQGTRSVMNIIWAIVAVVFWILVALVIIANLGIDVTSLVASLGIGGIAVALAVQNVLSDLLSSFSIYMDKPFTVGDFIVIGTDKGTVEKIGLKTTRLRSITGEELVISNKELTSARINNYKRMKRRRDNFTIGVVYETSKAKLAKIPKIIKQAINNVDELDFSRCHFVEFADFSLNFLVVYYINTPDYEVFLDAKEKVLIEIFEEFNKEKISFAYPTREIIIRK